MNNQNIIVYQFNFLYKILKEIEKEIHFKIISISNEKLLTTLTIEGRNTGARLTIPVEVSKKQAITTAAVSDALPSESI